MRIYRGCGINECHCIIVRLISVLRPAFATLRLKTSLWLPLDRAACLVVWEALRDVVCGRWCGGRGATSCPNHHSYVNVCHPILRACPDERDYQVARTHRQSISSKPLQRIPLISKKWPPICLTIPTRLCACLHHCVHKEKPAGGGVKILTKCWTIAPVTSVLRSFWRKRICLAVMNNDRGFAPLSKPIVSG